VGASDVWLPRATIGASPATPGLLLPTVVSPAAYAGGLPVQLFSVTMLPPPPSENPPAMMLPPPSEEIPAGSKGGSTGLFLLWGWLGVVGWAMLLWLLNCFVSGFFAARLLKLPL